MSTRTMVTLLDRERGKAAAPGALAPFDPGSRDEWAWRQPAALRAAWRLEAGGAPVLALTVHGLFRSRAELRSASNAWTLRVRFPGGVRVQAEGAAGPALVYRPGWFEGGRIEREGRDPLLWRRESFWHHRWGVLTGEKLPLFHLQRRLMPLRLRREAGIELEDAARRLEDLPELLGLAWLLALRAKQGHGAH